MSEDNGPANILTMELQFPFKSVNDAQMFKNSFIQVIRDSPVNMPTFANQITNNTIRWGDVKEQALTSDRATEFLRLFGQFRTLFVNALLQFSAKENSCLKRCRAYGTGSVSLVSDYDVSVFGMRGTHTVEKFNEIFEEVWGNTPSADIFDTNIYGAAYYFPILPGNYGMLLNNLGGENRNFWFVDINNEKDVRFQRVWATLKLYRYTKHGFSDILFSSDIRTVYERLLTYTDTTCVDTHNNTTLNHLYESKMKLLPQLRQDYEFAGQCDEVSAAGVAFKQQIALSNFYGNETYFTQGAFFHVVGLMQLQLQIDPKITVDMYADSVIENTGDFIKECYHLMENNDSPAKRGRKSNAYLNLQLFVKGSKYLSRVAHGLCQMQQKTSQPRTGNGLLAAAIGMADTIKKELRTKSEYNSNDINMIKSLMLAFEISATNADVQDLKTCAVAVLRYVIVAMRQREPRLVLPFIVSNESVSQRQENLPNILTSLDMVAFVTNPVK